MAKDLPSGIFNWLLRFLRTSHRHHLLYSIDDVLHEAGQVLNYACLSATPGHDQLRSSLEAVFALPEDRKVFGDPVVIALQAQLDKAREGIPFPTIVALRSGWRPDRDRWRERGKNGFFVAVALLMMMVVAHLTQIYGRGASIKADLVELSKSSPAYEFGRLERRILFYDTHNFGFPKPRATGEIAPRSVGQEEPRDITTTAPTEEALLANEAVFRYVSDLVELDRNIKLLETRATIFQTDANDPLRYIRNSFCEWYLVGQICNSEHELLLSALKIKETSAPLTDSRGDFNQGQSFQYSNTIPLSIFCPNQQYISAAINKDSKESIIKESSIDKLMLDYIQKMNYLFYDRLGFRADEIIEQNCNLNMNYFSSSLPYMESIITTVSHDLNRYSFIILPCLYGALGSLVYYMRRILDPLQPNPSFSRMIFRVALGALAGMSLAWLWEGVIQSNDELNAVGFGLFTLAFVFGFSIDVFFSLLERLVALANTAVQKIGT